jgi:serine/threonine protein kinase
MPDNVSEECRDLIERILRLEPQDRITMPEIRQHPWFGGPVRLLPGCCRIIIVATPLLL